MVPCSGHFEPGTLVALMGPSGSGTPGSIVFVFVARHWCLPAGSFQVAFGRFAMHLWGLPYSITVPVTVSKQLSLVL